MGWMVSSDEELLDNQPPQLDNNNTDATPHNTANDNANSNSNDDDSTSCNQMSTTSDGESDDEDYKP
jgi:hypothetical protein